MYIPTHDPYIEEHHRAPRYITWPVWLAWVAANYFGLTLGIKLAESVQFALAPQVGGSSRALSLEGHFTAVGPLNLLPVLIGVVLAGAILGITQAVILVPFLKLDGAIEWIVATAIGRGVGLLSLYLIGRETVRLVLDKHIVGACVLFFILVGTALILGFALGHTQGIVLRRRVEATGLWLLANMPGPIFTALVLEGALYFEGQNTIRDFATTLTALISGAVTGVALVELLNHPTMRAEWSKWIKWRKERPKPPAEDTVLGSTLYGPAQLPQSPVSQERTDQSIAS